MADGTRRDLTFRFLGDTKSLEAASGRASKSLGGVDSKAGSASKSVGLLGKAGLALGGAFAASRVVSAIGDTVSAASNLGESINAVKVTTGEASSAIFALGETADQSLGLSKRAVNDAAVAFSAFGEKIAPGNVAGVFEDYITRATDFASVMNLDVQEALDKFRSGLAGESEPLRAFGLDLSAASVGAYAVANGIAESASSMTESEKVQARYGLLMQQTAKTAGDFANTSDELANSQRILSAEWENAQAEIGENLIPVVQDLLPLLIKGAEAVGTFGGNLEMTLKAIHRYTQVTTEAERAMFEFDKIAGFLNQRLRDTESPATVAAEAMADLAKKGALTADTLKAIQDATGATTDEMAIATGYVKDHAEEMGIAADKVGAVEDASRDYARQLDRETIQKQDDFSEGARDLAFEVKTAAGQVDDLVEETVNLADEMRKLADPVYKAKKAVEDYDQALIDARDDAIITSDELLGLAEKFGDAEAAKGELTAANMDAFNTQLGDAAVDAGATAEALGEAAAAVDRLTASGQMEQFAGFISRLETVAGRGITIDFSNLRFATDAELEQAILRSIYSLQRKGSIRPIAL